LLKEILQTDSKKTKMKLEKVISSKI
jgi:hypothetical protein